MNEISVAWIHAYSNGYSLLTYTLSMAWYAVLSSVWMWKRVIRTLDYTQLNFSYAETTFISLFWTHRRTTFTHTFRSFLASFARYASRCRPKSMAAFDLKNRGICVAFPLKWLQSDVELVLCHQWIDVWMNAWKADTSIVRSLQQHFSTKHITSTRCIHQIIANHAEYRIQWRVLWERKARILPYNQSKLVGLSWNETHRF